MSDYSNPDWVVESFKPDENNSLQLAQDLFDKGLIFLANQNALHHYGYALGVTVDETTKKVLGINIHKTSDPDGIWFDEELTIAGRRKLKGAFDGS